MRKLKPPTRPPLTAISVKAAEAAPKLRKFGQSGPPVGQGGPGPTYPAEPRPGSRTDPPQQAVNECLITPQHGGSPVGHGWELVR